VAVGVSCPQDAQKVVRMIIYLAGHGHVLQRCPRFAKQLADNNANFLVSFAYPEDARMAWVKSVNDERKAKKAKKRSK